MRSKQLYQLCSNYQNATYQLEQWTNQLSNGKNVTIFVISSYRRGVFTIELYLDEQYELLNRPNIILHDYQLINDDLYGCYYKNIEIQHKNLYTTDELREINQLCYLSIFLHTDDGYDSSVDYLVNEDVLHDNDWRRVNTIYSIHFGGSSLNVIHI